MTQKQAWLKLAEMCDNHAPHPHLSNHRVIPCAGGYAHGLCYALMFLPVTVGIGRKMKQKIDKRPFHIDAVEPHKWGHDARAMKLRAQWCRRQATMLENGR